ncbi:ATP-binding protein [Microbacterium timonense]|uniref:ATP-binding protein n=1 Tax=Microbacterium timonense TaxID=2086576 RepID=UPI00190E6599|nr:AAA family ATPase [Microbacterium timonense]
MRLRFFGGLEADADGVPIEVRGRGQQALLFRLALDAGTTVSYRALAEDIWPDDAPDDPRAALHSLASRLRRMLPDGVLEAVPGGYRLNLDRDDVDVARFQDGVARARRTDDSVAASAQARNALELWRGDPWTPGAGFDWVVRDLLEDRAHATRIAAETSPRTDTRGIAGPSAPATTTPAVPVPAPLTALIGRAAELDLIDAQLRADRLVTLIGPGGAGKTTLAFETARRRPGSVVVELAPAAPGDVWAAVAGAVGRSIRVGELVSTSARDRVAEALAGRSLLIVLDNCEHVSAEAAAVAVDLLGIVPGSRILATSREPLGLAGEAFVDLGPLPGEDARELFARRVRAARGHPPTPDEQVAAERIVSRLDGLPLALELAAAKSRTLTLAEIDEGLDDRFALLATGPRSVEPRHQTLRALIDWSWETLTDAERTALLTVAVFPDGVDARDIRVVGAAFEVGPEAFEALVDKSLVRRVDGRLRMLETVREYGIDRLRSQRRESDFRARQARAMATLAEREDARLRGPGVREGLAWFDADEENLTAAMRACTEQPGLGAVGVRLVRASLWTWLMRERFDDLQAGIRRFGDAAADLDSEAAVVVRAVAALGTAFDRDGPTRDGLALLDEDGPRIIAAAGVHRSELTAVLPPLLSAIGEAARGHRSGVPWSRAVRIGDEGLDGAPAWSRAFLSMLRSAIAQNSGDTETLGVESERALSTFRELGDVWGTAFASQMRSEWLQLAGRLEEALAVADSSTAALEGLTSVADLIQQRSTSIGLLLRLGRVAEARERLAQTRSLAIAADSPRAAAQADMAAATIEIAVGDGSAALKHLERVDLEVAPTVPEQLLAWSGSKRAQALLLLGRLDEAHAALADALPAATRSGDHPIISDVVISIAGWLAATGREADARRALASAARLRGGYDAGDPFLVVMRRRVGAEALTLPHPADDDSRPRAEEAADRREDDELAVLADFLR